MLEVLLLLVAATTTTLRFSPPVRLSAVGTYMTGFQGVDNRHALGNAASGWTATHDGGASWSPVIWSNRSALSAVRSSQDPSLKCTGWPPGGTGTNVQKCMHGNALHDGYLYVYNKDRGTASAACGEAAQCDCCRCTEDATGTQCAPPPLAPKQSLSAAVLLPGSSVLRGVSVDDVPSANKSYTSLTDRYSTKFWFDKSTQQWAFNESATRTTFRGIPAPGVSCGNAKHAFGCPFRLSGRGYVRLPDSTLVMSVIVYAKQWANPNPKLAEEATSIIAFRSTNDGLDWDYAGLIIAARDAPTSEEGPNENDLVLAGDGTTILCVLRLDAGDGPTTHRYTPYALSASTDGGRTWSPPESMGDGVGCARPRLLRCASGAVVLAGGRLHPNNHDTYVWSHSSAMSPSAYATNGSWTPHSISYQHNLLEPNASLHFTSEVNGSGFRQTTSYTSLVKTGAEEGFVVYARHLPPFPDVAFSMSFVVVHG